MSKNGTKADENLSVVDTSFHALGYVTQFRYKRKES